MAKYPRKKIDENTLIRLVNQGKTDPEIGRYFSISTTTICNKRHELEYAGKLTRDKKVDEKKVLAMLRVGKTVKCIARELLCSEQRINDLYQQMIEEGKLD